MSLRKINTLVILIITATLILMKINFLELPFIGDGHYYGQIIKLPDLSKLTSFTFGHPPGWVALMNISYFFLVTRALLHTQFLW
jgi:hypothetical protein